MGPFTTQTNRRGVVELKGGKEFSLCDERDADRVCRGILRAKAVDGYMFAKTCLAYWKTSKILREVDWDHIDPIFQFSGELKAGVFILDGGQNNGDKI